MNDVSYREVEVKSALYEVRGMPFEWSLNPYRGKRGRRTQAYALICRWAFTLRGMTCGTGAILLSAESAPELRRTPSSPRARYGHFLRFTRRRCGGKAMNTSSAACVIN